VTGPLAGRVVVVVGPSRSVARALAGDGATVVLVGSDATELGEIARTVDDAGARSAVFVGDPDEPADRSALAELLAEVFAATS
jgi:NAD(P)-dependent dehydrogenase (short-subunit alcohol dehydrogenase family)